LACDLFHAYRYNWNSIFYRYFHICIFRESKSFWIILLKLVLHWRTRNVNIWSLYGYSVMYFSLSSAQWLGLVNTYFTIIYKNFLVWVIEPLFALLILLGTFVHLDALCRKSIWFIFCQWLTQSTFRDIILF
jgi:hypothetical protein